MSVMDQEGLLVRTNVLKVELKVWERDFAAANNGKKASREDIKGNPVIAAKYKEYNKARDVLSGKIPPPEPTRQTPRKRKLEDEFEHGVSKRQQIAKTPSKTPTKGTLRPWELDPYDSPSVARSLFTPSKKSLGPTPQKEGLVLGLFDFLIEDGPALKPEAKNNGVHIPMAATPKRLKADAHGLKHTRTPGSQAKRRLLDAFSTPLKDREANGCGGQMTPVSKLVFSTPSFLRRAPLPTLTEDDNGPISPQMVRVPRKPLVRGLSSILAGLKKMEDDAADEDLEALHEMEMMEMEGENAPIRKPSIKPIIKVAELEPPADILVEDSQTGILGGFDDEAQLDSDVDEEITNLGRDGQPLKVYKKKGQKRTTRRTNMKPSRSKPIAATTHHNNSSHPESEDELSIPSLQAVPETQEDDETANFTSARNFDSDTQSEYTASEGGTRYRRPNQERKKSKNANKDGRIKTAARKVTALAGQNFKRLKLRNSGSKGGPAQNSRFRRKK